MIRILLYFALLSLFSSLCLGSTQYSLHSALQEYEDVLFQLVLSGSSTEKASAVRALAELGSPRYESARDKLIPEKDPNVKIALLESIPLMTDTSQRSKELVAGCLTSNSLELIIPACSAYSPNPDVTFDFENLWRKSSLLRLWKEYGLFNNCSFLVERLRGIGEARPWNDPAWDETPRELKKVLLERAGTREAIERLKQISVTDENHYGIAEPVDPVFLNELVVGSDSSLKSYAARSLIKAKDLTYIQRVRTVLHQSLQGAGYKEEKIVGSDLYWILPFLDDFDIQRLALQQLSLPDGDQWQRFSTLNRELNRRGKVFSYYELTAKNFPHISERHLRFFRIGALVRQRLYRELPVVLKELLPNKSELSEHSFLNLKFLSALPDDIAHECLILLKSQLPEKDDYSHRSESETILRLIGLFAKGKDQEILWKEFRRHRSPYMDERTYIPIFWGVNERSAVLRRILHPLHSDWLPSPNDLYYFDFPSETGCTEPSYLFSNLFAELPVVSDRVWKEGLAFASKLNEIYGDEKWQSLTNDFLRLRGVDLSNLDLPSSLIHLKDDRFILRRLVVDLSKNWFPELTQITYPRYFQTIDDFMNSHAAYIEANRGFVPSLPGPRLSKADEQWFQKLLESAKEAIFQRRIYEFHNPPHAVVETGIGPPDTKIYPAQPSGFFLRDGSRYLEQLNRLKTATDENLRYEALWALWHLKRDPVILQTWMKDANTKKDSATDLFLKARALFVLQKIRYKPSASLFLPLLHHSTPLLRQTALFGVQTFIMKEAIYDVKQLLKDSDEAVSETAIETLGFLQSQESRAILINYLNGTYRQSFVANAALKQYRTRDNIDEMAMYIQRRNLTGQQRIILFDVVSELTYRPEPTWKYWNDKFDRVPEESIENWLRWWEENKDKPRITWYESAIEQLIQKFPTADAQEIRRISWNLQRLLGQNPERFNREKLHLWWQINKTDDIWRIKLHEYSLPYQYLFEINPEKTLRMIFSRFVEGSRKGKLEGDYHELLVNYTGEDFGNPGLAHCSIKERILDDWIRWAQSEGLYPN